MMTLVLFMNQANLVYSGSETILSFSCKKYSRERDHIKSLLENEIKEAESIPGAEEVCIKIAKLDLNYDGSDEIFAYIEQYPYFCGSRGCRFYVFIVDDEYWRPALNNIVTGEDIKISSFVTGGFRDLILEENIIWRWSGRIYEVR